MCEVTALLSMEEAQRLILERALPLEAEPVALDSAAGRVPAEPARSRVDLPPFDSSAMDGFAVRSGDTPGRLPVSERIPAGKPAGRPLEPGEAMGIATGGTVPDRRRRSHPARGCCRSRQRDRDRGRSTGWNECSPREAGTSASARWSWSPASFSGQRRSARLRPPGFPSCRASGGQELRCSRPARSSGGRVRRSSPDRSTRRTLRCSRRSCDRSALRWRWSRRSRTTRPRTALRWKRGCAATCSSRRAASRSVRTISSARSVPASGSRRCSGEWP